MADMHAADFVPMFKAEARDRLRRAVEYVLALQRNPSAPGAVEECRREMHTVKGAAGMVGLSAIAQQARALEEVLARLGTGTEPLTPALLQRILTEIQELVEAVEAIG